MKKVPFTNNGKTVRHIGGKSIWPGDTRSINEYDHPDYKAEKPAEPEQPSLLSVLNGSVKSIVPLLPDFSDSELAELRAAETSGEKRKSLIDAMDKEVLRREEHARLSGELSAVLGDDDVQALMSAREKVAAHADLVKLVENRLTDLESGN